MHTTLPTISGAGIYHSQDKFSDLATYPENSMTKLRTVLDYELELFIRDGGITHLNGKSYPITKGSFLIAQPNDKRRSTLHYSTLFIHFGTNDQIIQNLIREISGFHSHVDFAKYYRLIMDICEIVLCFDPETDILAISKLLSLFYELKTDCFTASCLSPNVNHHSTITQAIEYMKQHYRSPLSVNDISAYCNLSASYFHKLFVSTTHITPNNYLLNLRLSAAKSLLASTTMSISEVAQKCGFQSSAYFSDCFRRHFNMCPGQFRKTFHHPDGPT